MAFGLGQIVQLALHVELRPARLQPNGLQAWQEAVPVSLGLQTKPRMLMAGRPRPSLSVTSPWLLAQAGRLSRRPGAKCSNCNSWLRMRGLPSRARLQVASLQMMLLLSLLLKSLQPWMLSLVPCKRWPTKSWNSFLRPLRSPACQDVKSTWQSSGDGKRPSLLQGQGCGGQVA